MALQKMTPIHIAIHTIDETIKDLQKQKVALLALLPREKRKKQDRNERYIINPYTKKKEYY